MKSKAEKSSLQTEMEGCFGPSHLRRVFKNSPWLSPNGLRDTFGGVQQPYFYESNGATVFLPVTDTEKKQPMCDTIEQMLKHTLLKDDPPLDKTKRMVFPVSEEQTIFFIPRNHWITLIYDPNSQIATLIDSRPKIYGWFYNTDSMQGSLRNGLEAIGLSLKDFDVKYQWIQYDDIHCGAWTAINIEAFAHCRSIEEQMTSFRWEDKDRVVQHHIDLVCSKKEQPYTHNDDTPTLPSVIDSNSSGSLDTLGSDEFCMVSEDCFSEQEKAAWIQTATELFINCFENPIALSLALIARENLTYNGQKLSDELLGTINVPELLSEIERKYDNFSPIQTSVYPQIVDGYGLLNPAYTASRLKNIGLTDPEIEAMRLSDMIRYDAALSSAMANAGHHTAYGDLQRADENLTIKARAELRAFELVLAAALKTAVKNQQNLEIEYSLEQASLEQEENTDLANGLSVDGLIEPPCPVIEVLVESDSSQPHEMTPESDDTYLQLADEAKHHQDDRDSFKNTLALLLTRQRRDKGSSTDTIVDMLAAEKPATEQRPTFDNTVTADTIVDMPATEQHPTFDNTVTADTIVDMPAAEQRPTFDNTVTADTIVDMPAAEQYPTFDNTVTADFQMQCIRALIITGCVLLTLAVLISPPIAGVLGIIGAISIPISSAAAGLGGLSLLVGFGLFATRLFTNTTNIPSNDTPHSTSLEC